MKHHYFRSKKIRDSARDKPCTLRLPGVCNNNPETTVFCHLNYAFAGKGLGIKGDDVGIYACSDCHRTYDGQNGKEWDQIEDKDYYLLRGLFETQRLIYLMIQDRSLVL